MQEKTVFIQKTPIRTRLIMACLLVSLLVAAIYVTVSYRLTADASTQVALKAMARVTSLLSSEFSKSASFSQSNVENFADHYDKVDAQVPYAFFIQSNKLHWEHTYQIDRETSSKLIGQVLQTQEDNKNLISVGDNNYLWYRLTTDKYSVTYIQQTTLLDMTQSLVSKRLLVTSFIVFWIAIWLALTLSSLVAKRADEINKSLADLATHDSLTGLRNRLYLTEKLPLAMANSGKGDNVPEGCLIAIDLDKFKDVNDAFGHNAGDKLLKEVSNRLLEVVGKSGEAIRIGGDEFFIWAPNCSLEMGSDLAKRIIAASDDTILIDGLELNTGVSVGLAHYPTHTNQSETLISYADAAMYQAIKQRSGWQTYDVEYVLKSELDIKLRTDLNGAMTNYVVVLHYQPKVDMRTNTIVGVEGLCRWQHPELGTLMPGSFIDLIEHSGKLQHFGRYVIHRSIQQSAKWVAMGLDVPIAINLSPYNLLDPGLIEYIKQTLQQYNVAPHHIQIELTENETCLNIEHIQTALENISKLGIQVAIDDFGTGMSSFAYLDRLKADILKIDRVFISDIQKNQGHFAIVSSAISLSESFGCSVVAEGVESKHQADLLVEMGCFIGQGYFFAKPLPEEQILPLLKARTC